MGLWPLNNVIILPIFCLLYLLHISNALQPNFIIEANNTIGAVRSGSILFAIYATKVQKQMREQTTIVLNSRNGVKPGPEAIKLFSCSTQLSIEFEMLITTKMLKSKDFYCFQTLISCIYHANKS